MRRTIFFSSMDIYGVQTSKSILQISQKDDRKKLKVKCSPAFSTYSLSYINDISAESAIIKYYIFNFSAS